MANDHLDAVAKVDAPTPAASTQATRATTKSVDNEAASVAAAQQREFLAGGGDGGDVAATAESGGAADVALERAIARVLAPERPSPFGVAQFPPLPTPSERRRE